MKYSVDNLGIVHQCDAKPFVYDLTYLNKQSTNPEMSYLRLTTFYHALNTCATRLKGCSALELGPGTGVFFEIAKKHFKTVDGYDVAQSDYSTVSVENLKRDKWDILFAFDVLEHLNNPEDLLKIDFTFGMITIPDLPYGIVIETDYGWDVDLDKLSCYKHFKPDEHLHYFSRESLMRWLKLNNCRVLHVSHVEDLIRGLNKGEHNTCTVVFEKLKSWDILNDRLLDVNVVNGELV